MHTADGRDPLATITTAALCALVLITTLLASALHPWGFAADPDQCRQVAQCEEVLA